MMTKAITCLLLALTSAMTLIAQPESLSAPPDTGAEGSVLEVKDNFFIPHDLFKSQTNEQILDVSGTLRGAIQDRLWLDVKYSVSNTTSVKNIRAAIAFLNPRDNAWEIVRLPRLYEWADVIPPQAEAVVNDGLYLASDSTLRRYDFQLQHWRTVEAPWEETPNLYAVGQRLVAVNSSEIFEITDAGKNFKTLASTRRNPALTPLDAVRKLTDAVPFEDAHHNLGVCCQDQIYTWTNNNWQAWFVLNYSKAEVFEGAILFRSPAYARRDPLQFWLWDKQSVTPELCLYEPSQVHDGRIVETPATAPTWKSWPGGSLAYAEAAYYQSNLYFFVAPPETPSLGRQLRLTHVPTQLVCLLPGRPEPLTVTLKLDQSATLSPPSDQPPHRDIARLASFMQRRLNLSRICFLGDDLYINLAGGTGVSRVPLAAIHAAIAESQEELRAAKQETDAATDQLLAKYDHNHNGVLDPDEMEEALEDPDFIASQIDHIDTNHNGRLDFAELSYFDANHNQVLDPQELTGIRLTQQLLATCLLQKYDQNHDGTLDAAEKRQFWDGERPFINPPGYFLKPSPEENIDLSDAQGLEDFLERYTKRSVQVAVRRGNLPVDFYNYLYPRETPMPVAPVEMPSSGGQQNTFDPQRRFLNRSTVAKMDETSAFCFRVEALWQNPPGLTNRIFSVEDPRFKVHMKIR